jgi:hypothetical protein
MPKITIDLGMVMLLLCVMGVEIFVVWMSLNRCIFVHLLLLLSDGFQMFRSCIHFDRDGKKSTCDEFCNCFIYTCEATDFKYFFCLHVIPELCIQFQQAADESSLSKRDASRFE